MVVQLAAAIQLSGSGNTTHKLRRAIINSLLGLEKAHHCALNVRPYRHTVNMQILALELSHCNLSCPVTGQQISAPGVYQASPAQMGLWLGGLLEQPEIRCATLQAAWEGYVTEHAADTGIYLDAFLQSVELPNYVCFAITQSGIGSGFYSSTVWYVFNMNYVAPADGLTENAALSSESSKINSLRHAEAPHSNRA